LSVDILVTNRNSREAIQLCVESVRFSTRTDPYRLVVYDDASDNGLDLPYLRDAQTKGWLTLIEGRERVLHGGALNILLSGCRADYAVILDCDVEIKQPCWLEEILALIQADPMAIAAVNCLPRQLRGPGHWLAPFAEWWFGILNMNAYRDGMEVDWRPVILSDRKAIHKVAPELDNQAVQQYIFDVGCQLLHKVKTANPKGYAVISPLPENLKQSFRHYLQISHQIDDKNERIQRHVNGKLAEIRAALHGIREAVRIHEIG